VLRQRRRRRRVKGIHSYPARYQGFRSSYSTPVPINPNAVKASYKNGILEVRAPKLKAAKGRKITVQ